MLIKVASVLFIFLVCSVFIIRKSLIKKGDGEAFRRFLLERGQYGN